MNKKILKSVGLIASGVITFTIGVYVGERILAKDIYDNVLNTGIDLEPDVLMAAIAPFASQKILYFTKF